MSSDRFVETRFFKFQVRYQQTDELCICWLQTHVPLMHLVVELLSSVELHWCVPVLRLACMMFGEAICKLRQDSY